MSLPRNQYSKPEEWLGFYTRLVERMKTEPGVEAAAAVLPLPLTGSGLNFAFTIEGRAAAAPGADLTANYTALTPDYFRVLGIPLRRGRLFTASDAASAPQVCVVSDAFVRRHFPGEDPLGKRLVFGFKEPIARTIVGVVGDVKRDGLGAPSQPEMYVPFEQDPWWAAYLAVRTRGDPVALTAAVRRAVAALDPTLPISDIQPMSPVRLGLGPAAALSHDAARPLRRHGAAARLSGSTASSPTTSAGARGRSGSGWRSARATRTSCASSSARASRSRAAGSPRAPIAAALLTRFLSTLLFETRALDAAVYGGVAIVLLGAGLAGLLDSRPARPAARPDPRPEKRVGPGASNRIRARSRPGKRFAEVDMRLGTRRTRPVRGGARDACLQFGCPGPARVREAEGLQGRAVLVEQSRSGLEQRQQAPDRRRDGHAGGPRGPGRGHASLDHGRGQRVRLAAAHAPARLLRRQRRGVGGRAARRLLRRGPRLRAHGRVLDDPRELGRPRPQQLLADALPQVVPDHAHQRGPPQGRPPLLPRGLGEGPVAAARHGVLPRALPPGAARAGRRQPVRLPRREGPRASTSGRCSRSIQPEAGWFGEGDDRFFVDGEKKPSLDGHRLRGLLHRRVGPARDERPVRRASRSPTARASARA